MMYTIIYFGLLGLLAGFLVGLLHVLSVFVPIWLQFVIAWLFSWVLVDIILFHQPWLRCTNEDLAMAIGTLDAHICDVERAMLRYHTIQLQKVFTTNKAKIRKSSSDPNMC